MLPVKVGILADHLRLEPQSELQALPVNRIGQVRETAAKLFFIGFPVSEPRIIRFPFSEPAVVEHKHFHVE